MQKLAKFIFEKKSPNYFAVSKNCCNFAKSKIGMKKTIKKTAKVALNICIKLLVELGVKDHLQQRQIDTLKLILSTIATDCDATLDTLARATGRARSTVQIHLRYLVDHGLISRVGPDKGGRWVLAEEFNGRNEAISY